MENYTYPRVSMSTTALKRSSVGPAVEDTTVLFAPIVADRGPTDKYVVCHTLSELIDTFGELSYEANKLQAFNVYNWLSNGGTVYARRLENGATKAFVKTVASVTVDSLKDAKVFAKYPGSWYNNLNVVITTRSTGYYDILIKDTTSGKTLEAFYRIKGDKYQSALSKSQYIEIASSVKDIADLLNSGTPGSTTVTSATLTFSSGGDGLATNNVLSTLVAAYFTPKTSGSGSSTTTSSSDAEIELGNALETPIDIILDAGWPKTTKEAIVKFIVGKDAFRPDIVAIFDLYGGEDSLTNTGIDTDNKYTSTNVAIYDQWFVVYDATFKDMNVTVCPSYFLSKLIPFNDLQYGIQFPTAGLRRGVLEDALEVNKNPRPSEKEALFKARVNYVEKTSREYAFMSQRTHDGSTEEEYTALSFLNNVRCLEKMKKELERLGREYLFEFNDSVTLSQLSNILNKYIGAWVNNRTLAYGVVDVSSDPYSSEKVNVTLNVRFTGTIEVISVDIIIE